MAACEGQVSCHLEPDGRYTATCSDCGWKTDKPKKYAHDAYVAHQGHRYKPVPRRVNPCAQAWTDGILEALERHHGII